MHARVVGRLFKQFFSDDQRYFANQGIFSKHLGFIVELVYSVVKTVFVYSSQVLASFDLSFYFVLKLGHVEQKSIDLLRPGSEHFIFKLFAEAIFRPIKALLKPLMADPTPAFKNEFLLSSEQCIPSESCDSILSLLNFSKILPSANGNSESVVVHFLFEKSIEAALLLNLLVLQFLD